VVVRLISVVLALLVAPSVVVLLSASRPTLVATVWAVAQVAAQAAGVENKKEQTIM
jgi:hypothetical protein